METVAKRYEVVVFTASLSKYADPLLDLMDRGQLIRWRLFREACVLFEGNYVKDLNCEWRWLLPWASARFPFACALQRCSHNVCCESNEPRTPALHAAGLMYLQACP